MKKSIFIFVMVSFIIILTGCSRQSYNIETAKNQEKQLIIKSVMVDEEYNFDIFIKENGTDLLSVIITGADYKSKPLFLTSYVLRMNHELIKTRNCKRTFVKYVDKIECSIEKKQFLVDPLSEVKLTVYYDLVKKTKNIPVNYYKSYCSKLYPNNNTYIRSCYQNEIKKFQANNKPLQGRYMYSIWDEKSRLINAFNSFTKCITESNKNCEIIRN